MKILKIKLQGTVKLKDGNILLIDGELATGVKVEIETPDGKQPLPNGSYELESGEIITVKDGVITEITEPETEPTQIEEQKEEPVVPTNMEMNLELTNKLTDLENKIKGLEGLVNGLKPSNNDEKIEKLEKELETILSKVTLAKETKTINHKYSFDDVAKILK